jgi:hypothetical protein
METEILQQLGMSASGIAIVLVAYRILKYLKGKTIVSKCCGRKVEMGIDVKENVDTPKAPDAIVIQNPMQK